MLRKVFFDVATDLIKLYLFFTGPWRRAKFYTAWNFYQQDDVYRERLRALGFKFAVSAFLDSKANQKYCLKMELLRHPELKWRIIFLPWTIQRPDIFDIATNSGITSYS